MVQGNIQLKSYCVRKDTFVLVILLLVNLVLLALTILLKVQAPKLIVFQLQQENTLYEGVQHQTVIVHQGFTVQKDRVYHSRKVVLREHFVHFQEEQVWMIVDHVLQATIAL
jgi:hypothetical protein